jgi:hypothetical protein
MVDIPAPHDAMLCAPDYLIFSIERSISRLERAPSLEAL